MGFFRVEGLGVGGLDFNFSVEPAMCLFELDGLVSSKRTVQASQIRMPQKFTIGVENRIRA